MVNQKRILGWDIDTCASTLSLPAHRLDRLYALLNFLAPPRKRATIQFWHRLLGELRSMAPALPGARGLFSLLQHALQVSRGHRIRVTRAIQDMAADFRMLADSLHERPTRLQELVHLEPTFVGASDASGHGMGGVWLSRDPTVVPIVWRQPFTQPVRAALITSTTPNGTISISDLELAALVAHKAILADAYDIAERTIWIATDNRAALSWSQKGSSTAASASAYLLRLNALHQRAHRYVATHDHIAGTANSMADDASRLLHLSDSALLTHFNTQYPQALPWRTLTLSSSMHSALTGALFKTRPVDGFPNNAFTPRPRPGSVGTPFAPLWVSTPAPCPRTPSPSCRCSRNGCEQALSPPAPTLSALEQWKTPFARWARRTPGWGPRTLV